MVSQGFTASHKNTGYRQEWEKEYVTLFGRRRGVFFEHCCLLLTLYSSLPAGSVRRWMSATQKYPNASTPWEDRISQSYVSELQWWQADRQLCWLSLVKMLEANWQRESLSEHVDPCTLIKPSCQSTSPSEQDLFSPWQPEFGKPSVAHLLADCSERKSTM